MLAAPMSVNNVPTMTPNKKSWPYFDPEYDSMSSLIDPPLVKIDNDADKDATLVKVSSQNKHGTLLEVVQELMDMDLTISKAYISSDGGWFMDVFHVTDQRGEKICPDKFGNIAEALKMQKKKWSAEFHKCPGRCTDTQTIAEHTSIELTGMDRPGLLSEVSAVLAEMNCRVNAAEVWTHKRRVACIIYVTDEDTLGPIDNVRKLDRILEKLKPIMQGYDNEKIARSVVAERFTHLERRLHQLMLADHDFGLSDPQSPSTNKNQEKLEISVDISNERNYSVITVKCPDRPKLLFDTVCTLTDLKYVVFHATIDSSGPYALQEYHIRQMDGQTLDAEAREKVKRCLEAAIERRTSEGLRLELCTSDRVGLLTDVTRIFRENGMSVTRADVSTQGDKAVNTFYVTDVNGRPVDLKTVEAIRKDNPLLGVIAIPPAADGARILDASPFSKFIKSSERFFQGLGWRV